MMEFAKGDCGWFKRKHELVGCSNDFSKASVCNKLYLFYFLSNSWIYCCIKTLISFVRECLHCNGSPVSQLGLILTKTVSNSYDCNAEICTANLCLCHLFGACFRLG